MTTMVSGFESCSEDASDSIAFIVSFTALRLSCFPMLGMMIGGCGVIALKTIIREPFVMHILYKSSVYERGTRWAMAFLVVAFCSISYALNDGGATVWA